MQESARRTDDARAQILLQRDEHREQRAPQLGAIATREPARLRIEKIERDAIDGRLFVDARGCARIRFCDATFTVDSGDIISL